MKLNIKVLLIVGMSFALFSCGHKLDKESVMNDLKKKSIYQAYFYAPIHIGKQVVTLDEGTSLESYITERYGKIQEAGLIDVKIEKQSSWRNVLNVELTDSGKDLCDPRRSDNEHAFVAVCKIHPVLIDTLLPLNEDSVLCKYTIKQEEITPFGIFLGYENGKEYQAMDTICTK